MSTETPVEQTASAPAPVENAAPTPADEGKAPELGSTDTPANAAETKPETEEQKRNKVSARERIGQLTRDKRLLEGKLKEFETKLSEIEQRNQPQEPKKPNFNDYSDPAQYEADLELYHQRKAEFSSTKAKQQETHQQAERRKQEARAEASQKFATALQKEKDNYQDIDKVLVDPTFSLIVNQMDPEVITLIQSSDKSVALAYHLATHIEDADWIASLAPIQAARELAKLESRLESPKPKTVSNAPDPIKPVQAKSTKDKDPATMTDAEFAAWRREKIRARGGRA